VLPAEHAGPALFVMALRLLMGLAFHIFQTIWMVALQTRFDFGPKDYGRYYAFIGLAFALSQGLGAKIVLQYFGTTLAERKRLLLFCSSVLGLGRWFVYQTHSLIVVYILYGLIITALGVVNTIVTADTSQLASPKELGGLFGILASVESMSGIIGPMLGGMLATLHPIHAPLTAVVGLYGIVFAMVHVGYEQVLAVSTKHSNYTTSSSSSNKGGTTTDKRKDL
jgi:MFS family permease